jgi:hypothetical protein
MYPPVVVGDAAADAVVVVILEIGENKVFFGHSDSISR